MEEFARYLCAVQRRECFDRIANCNRQRVRAPYPRPTRAVRRRAPLRTNEHGGSTPLSRTAASICIAAPVWGQVCLMWRGAPSSLNTKISEQQMQLTAIFVRAALSHSNSNANAE